MMLADLFSRSSDSSQIFTGHAAYVEICRGWTYATMDVFAGAGRDEHVASPFFTEYPDHRALGHDAFSQS